MDCPITFRCPICESPLHQEGRSFVCDNKHNFDSASEGYLNLLPVQEKNSKNPGDNKEMAHSRQHFLNKDYYLPLAERIAALAEERRVILDAGCGEGYYLEQLQKQLGSESKLIGVDISKTMVSLAAKRKINVQLAVASSYKLPFFDETVSCIVSVFAPVSPLEFARVLSSEGILIMVGPGTRHLEGLVAQVFGSAVAHKGNYESVSESTLLLTHEEEVEARISIAKEDLTDLLTMTPYGWHATLEQKGALAKLGSLDTPIHFLIRVYRKR